MRSVIDVKSVADQFFRAVVVPDIPLDLPFVRQIFGIHRKGQFYVAHVGQQLMQFAFAFYFHAQTVVEQCAKVESAVYFIRAEQTAALFHFVPNGVDKLVCNLFWRKQFFTARA